jgi:uncharacterized protein with WD repeat
MPAFFLFALLRTMLALYDENKSNKKKALAQKNFKRVETFKYKWHQNKGSLLCQQRCGDKQWG